MTPTGALHIATPRLTFFCRTWGADDGIPVLLLHGSYGTSRWWERFAAALPEEIYAVAPDLRGCGQTRDPSTGHPGTGHPGTGHPGTGYPSTSSSEAGYSVPEQAADLAALVQALGWVDFHLVAHSSSGAIALEYVLSTAEPPATLTLVDSAPIEGVFTPLDAYLLLERMRSDRALLAEAMALLMPALVEQAAHDPATQAYFDQLVDDAQHMAPAAFTATAHGLSQWNRFADARQITLPTLLVWGERDVVVDREATTRTLIAIPGANNLELLHGVGHSPMLEAPAVLADRFVDFITQDFAGFDALRRSV